MKMSVIRVGERRNEAWKGLLLDKIRVKGGGERIRRMMMELL